MRTTLLKCLTLLGFVLITATGHATILKGSFSGHAINSTWYPVADGTAVSGSFSLDTSKMGLSSHYYFTDEAFSLAVDAPSVGFHHDLLLMYGWLDVSNDGPRQYVEISTTFPHGEAAYIKLGGATGTFFSDPPGADLHGGVPDLALSALSIATHAFIGFDVDLDSLTFGETNAVPEPASLALVAAGLLAAAARRRPSR